MCKLETQPQHDPQRWQAVHKRQAAADGEFWYGVRTTGIYCYPSCAARKPKRENILYFASVTEAEAAGFRACRRCRPDLPPRSQELTRLIVQACQSLVDPESPVALEALAKAAGLSPFHFQRLFKQVTGVTPKQYAKGQRSEKMRHALATQDSVTAAIYAAGYSSSSRFYEFSQAMLGMRPTAYARGGTGESIRWQVAACDLGQVLVAATEKGLCAIFLGEGAKLLQADLAQRFAKAKLEQADSDSNFAAWVRQVVALVNGNETNKDLPMDIRGTLFQQKVWQALREIPAGQTATYSDIANKIGKAKAVRAVASACAANPLAVIIPCHRVLRRDGGIGGYRWGEERKRSLLDREKGG